MKNWIVFITLIYIPITAVALNDEEPCSGSSAMHQGICVSNKLEVADKELNKTYQEAIERIKEEDKYLNRNLEETFRKSQRAWLKYRDAYCEFKGESTGAAGGWAGVQIAICVLDITQERILYFKSVFLG